LREVRKSAERRNARSEFPGTPNSETPPRIRETPSSANSVVLQPADMVVRARGQPLRFCRPSAARERDGSDTRQAPWQAVEARLFRTAQERSLLEAPSSYRYDHFSSHPEDVG
jgi:hypothetical protein